MANEVTPAARHEIEALLQDSREDAEALRLLRASSESLFLQAPAATFAARVTPPPPARWTGWWRASLVAAAVGAAVLLWIVPKEEPDFQTKGSVSWSILANGPKGTRALKAEETVFAGETLSFHILSPQPLHVAVIAHAPDGWWVYAPANGHQSLLSSAGQWTLPDGARLDGTEGRETLYLISSEHVFSPETIQRALERGTSLSEVHIESVALTKTSP